MKPLKKWMAPLLAGILFSSLSFSVVNANAATYKGAPKVLKGTWVTKVQKLPSNLKIKGTAYQRTIWYVNDKSTDESGLFYKTKTKPAKMFNDEAGGGVNKDLHYTKHGNTYYLSSHYAKNYFNYRAQLVTKNKIKLFSSYNKQATKWEYVGEYYKQSAKLIQFTPQTKIKE